MKKLIKILALVVFVGVIFSSCHKKQKCAAYNKVVIEQAR